MTRNRNTPGNKDIWLALVMMIGCLFLSGCSTQTSKVYRVGILNGAAIFSEIVDGFKAKMTELGYAESENIMYDIRQSNGDPAEEPVGSSGQVAGVFELR